MVDRFSQLRQFGQDIGSAIQAPSAARLRAEQFKYQVKEHEEAKARLKKQDARQDVQDLRSEAEFQEKEKKRKAREKGVALAEQGKVNTPEYDAAMIESGTSLYDLKKLKNPKVPKTPKPTRYEEKISNYEKFQKKLFSDLGTLGQQAFESIGSDEGESLREEYVAAYDSGNKALQEYYDDFYAARETADYQRIAKVRDQELVKYSPQEIGVFTEAMNNTLIKEGGAVGATMKKLEDGDHNFSKYTDLSGIPSIAEVNSLLDAARLEGGLTAQDEKAILSIKSPKKLRELIEEKSTPETIRIVAATIIKTRVSAQLMEDREGRRVMRVEKDQPQPKRSFEKDSGSVVDAKKAKKRLDLRVGGDR